LTGRPVPDAWAGWFRGARPGRASERKGRGEERGTDRSPALNAPQRDSPILPLAQLAVLDHGGRQRESLCGCDERKGVGPRERERERGSAGAGAHALALGGLTSRTWCAPSFSQPPVCRPSWFTAQHPLPYTQTQIHTAIALTTPQPPPLSLSLAIPPLSISLFHFLAFFGFGPGLPPALRFTPAAALGVAFLGGRPSFFFGLSRAGRLATFLGACVFCVRREKGEREGALSHSLTTRDRLALSSLSRAFLSPWPPPAPSSPPSS